MTHTQKKHRFFNPFQIVVLGFAGVIFLGALLLMLPIASKTGTVTPFIDALFSATTSVCVTGLVVYDTGTYWTTFGHIIILFLIQIGGLGVITVASSVTIMSGKKISLLQRNMMQDAVSAQKVGGVVRLTSFVVMTTFVIELIGAVCLAPAFCKDFGMGKGLWMSIFHSISAFCNAGIDLLGVRGEFSSFTSYSDNPFVTIPLMILIIAGGIGYLTWDDIHTNGFKLKRYRMQSKVILSVTTLLIFIPAGLFFVFEYQHLPLGERVLASLFQSISPRTAGFNTTDLTAVSDSGKLLTIFLMLVGGSPGSTAGGMKTTTFAVLLGCVICVFRKKDSVHFYGRRIAHEAVLTASTIAFMYIGLPSVSALIISYIEQLPMMSCLYETVSAVATVGLTLGITTELGTVSKLILIMLMFFGRVGVLTIVSAAMSERRVQMGRLPQDKITVG